ncbi:hypothetical protein [Tomitella biformata]|uniref:hypothetical protein n=1 Tax=Tomitella biformata TaxID=630403 RepID=UPI000467DAD6|nr:hypothetical protein [Tomitella biformata]
MDEHAAGPAPGLRDAMAGLVPLPGRLRPWQVETLDHVGLAELLTAHGSPVNLIDPEPLTANAAALVAAGAELGVTVRICFARKANKALALVDQAAAAGHGIDVSSDDELAQVLARGVEPEKVILTAAVKPARVLDRAIRAGVAISVDSADELAAIRACAAANGIFARIAPRVAPDLPHRPLSRFGLPVGEVRGLLTDPGAHVEVVGLHVHLDGYDIGDRVVMLHRMLDLVEQTGATLRFVDLGGGIPIRYLDDPAPWQEFWQAHRAGLLGDGPEQTWRNKGLGLAVHGGQIHGAPAVYPAWQETIVGDWLRQILDGTPAGGAGESAAVRLRRLGLALQLEPGRALLEGCGLTAARVEARKQLADGSWLAVLAMNRTQCRSAADDFLVDPILLPNPDPAADRSPAAEGFLVGAYCIEAELITLRRMRFPRGLAVGDIVVFVNTAGYLMHIVESASHQMPLARNLIRVGAGWQLDPLDGLPDR